MRTLLVYIVLIFATAVLFAWQISKEPGYIQIVYKDWELETSFWLGMLMILGTFLGLYFLARFLVNLLTRKGWLGRWLGKRRRANYERQTHDGLVSYFAGDAERARRLLLQAAPNSLAPQVNYLMAARASQSLGEHDKVDEYLAQAEAAEKKPDNLAIGITKAEIQLANDEVDAAIETLTPLKAKARKHPAVYRMLLDAYQEKEDWGAVLGLLGDVQKSKAIDEKELSDVELNASELLLANAARNKDDMAAAWKRVPKHLQNNPHVVTEYVQGLLNNGKDAAAEKVLRNILTSQWDDKFVRLFGSLQSGNAKKQLLFVEGLQQSNVDKKDNVELQSAIGRLALRAQDWSKAKQFLQASIDNQPTALAYKDLGRLYASQGEYQQGAKLMQNALDLAEIQGQAVRV